MRGLELARRFWEANADELFAGELTGLRSRAAAGLVGEGSECWGFDDEISRDHDWGPGCCIWLLPEDHRVYGGELSRRYAAAAARGVCGFLPRPAGDPGAPARVGVFSIVGFYQRFLPAGIPTTLDGWRRAKEGSLAAACNGSVFFDGAGEFSRIRESLLTGYPEDLRLHRIACGCVQAAQAGQYNLPRQMARGEWLAAASAFSRFIDASCQMSYALAGRFRPFYKWQTRGLSELGPAGAAVHARLGAVDEAVRARSLRATVDAVEEVARALVAEMAAQGLTESPETWLLEQAPQVNAHVRDDALRCSNLME